MTQHPQPSEDVFDLKDRVGHLILITVVHERRRRYDDQRGAEVDEYVVDVADLEVGLLDPEERVVISHLANTLAEGYTDVLGRVGLTSGTGDGDEFVLLPFTDDDIDNADNWLRASLFPVFWCPPRRAKGVL